MSWLIFVVFLAFFQDEDSCSDCSNQDKPGTRLQSFVPEGTTHFPEVFQTSHLLFYERFRAYQDYILGESVLFFASFIFSLQVDCLTQSLRLPALGSEKVDLSGFINFSLLYALSILTVSDLFVADCKASEVREFTAEFLEKVLESSGWRAVWHTNVFEVLVEVNLILLLRHLSLAKRTFLQTFVSKVLIFNESL